MSKFPSFLPYPDGLSAVGRAFLYLSLAATARRPVDRHGETRRGRGPAVNMTDAERERVKMKVRKKEADGGLNTRLLYT